MLARDREFRAIPIAKLRGTRAASCQSAHFLYVLEPAIATSLLLENRVALVVSVSAAALAARSLACLQTKGATVCLTARTEIELSATAAEIDSATHNRQAAFVTADVTHEPDCTRVVAAAREKFGRIDILVNNAGHYGPVVPVEEYPLAEFDRVIAVQPSRSIFAERAGSCRRCTTAGPASS